jgi:hypothetical protein
MSRTHSLQVGESVISLEGEMSPKATEGVGSAARDLLRQMEVGALCEAIRSGRVAAISPARGEIGCHLRFRLSNLATW